MVRHALQQAVQLGLVPETSDEDRVPAIVGEAGRAEPVGGTIGQLTFELEPVRLFHHLDM
ncbi:MAG TPA: hypothetical protein VGI55_09220 [Solirubrobacteraceae bacterium]